MTIKITKDERAMIRINGKVKELLGKHDLSVQGIIDEWIEKNVVFVIDPKTGEVKTRNAFRKK